MHRTRRRKRVIAFCNWPKKLQFFNLDDAFKGFDATAQRRNNHIAYENGLVFAYRFVGIIGNIHNRISQLRYPGILTHGYT